MRTLLASLALATMLAFAALAQGQDDTTTAPYDGFGQATSIEAEAKAAAAILRRDRAAGDAIRAELAERIDADADFGMNPALSRRAIGGVANSLYLLPATGHVCAALTVADGLTLSCVQTDRFAAGEVGPGTVLLPDGPVAVWGVVPDGVDSVALEAGPESRTVEVTANGYLAVVPAGTPLESVSYTGPSGTVEYAIQDPSASESAG